MAASERKDPVELITARKGIAVFPTSRKNRWLSLVVRPVPGEVQGPQADAVRAGPALEESAEDGERPHRLLFLVAVGEEGEQRLPAAQLRVVLLEDEPPQAGVEPLERLLLLEPEGVGEEELRPLPRAVIEEERPELPLQVVLAVDLPDVAERPPEWQEPEPGGEPEVVLGAGVPLDRPEDELPEPLPHSRLLDGVHLG